MYEDFNYITDENFLTNYWRKEKIMCPYCQGRGKLSFDSEEELIKCHLCQGTGWVTNQQYKESLCLDV
ncbi:hypothetical protein [Gloeothece verrucosa]|uniref:Fructose-bisphosphate aldolase n=1 Tax=Gloeothece verrucosa (strain PCC 7822) TaxID=497965 RepID=E0U6V3_GLOV7|nr:hypothetical protein [Gloeothece verrucosa]ADN15990.1 fructose-bisphosphate aldolase [Gloeothece verrucosa PCC 7822]